MGIKAISCFYPYVRVHKRKTIFMKKTLAILLIFISIMNVYGQQLEKCDSTKFFWIIENGNSNYILKIIGKAAVTERIGDFSKLCIKGSKLHIRTI